MEEENRRLRAKLEKLEKEHRDLKRAYFELSLSRQGSVTAGGEVYRLTKESKDGVSNGESETDSKCQTNPKLSRVPATTVPEDVATPDVKRAEDRRIFMCSHELSGHTGAVYSIRFNRGGSLLASGGLDKTVRVWNLENLVGEKPSHETFADHSMHVSDMAWNSEGMLASASYDKTVKLFDVGAGKLAASIDLEGFGLSTVFVSNDVSLLVAGTSHGQAVLMDIRAAKPVARFNNGAMVNAVEADGDGARFLTGDGMGVLKAWDLRGRADSPVWTMTNGPEPECAAGRGVWHLQLTLAGAGSWSGGEEGPGAGGALAVNGLDGSLRVYAYGASALASDNPATQSSACPLRPLQAIGGRRSRNLPIRSAIHLWARPALASSPDPLDPDDARRACAIPAGLPPASQGTWGRVRRATAGDSERWGLVATGSCEDAGLLFALDRGGGSGGDWGGGELLQRLEGHRDRVYSAQFNPARPEMATCSADGSVRLWTTASSSL